MHRFYQPILPSSNLFLQHKWDFINFEMHRQKVRHICSKIDQTAPRTYTHMYIKPKLLQLEMERFSTIQRENKVLLDKLQKIHRYGGWLDNDNTQHKPRSINTLSRQKEAVRICNENRTLLSRIKDGHTSYNRSKLENFFELQQKYRANIDKFPRDWKDMSKDMKRYRAEIRTKYVYPKYGKGNSQKTSKITESNLKSDFSDVNLQEPGSIAIEVPSRAYLTEDKKNNLTILKRIKNVFAEKRDKDTVLEGDEEELNGNDSEDGINQDKDIDEENKEKEGEEVHQDKEKNKVTNDNLLENEDELEMEGSKATNEVNKVKECCEDNQDNAEVFQDKEKK